MKVNSIFPMEMFPGFVKASEESVIPKRNLDIIRRLPRKSGINVD